MKVMMCLILLTMLVFSLIIWFALIGTILAIFGAVGLALFLGFMHMCADVYEWWSK